MCGIAGVLKSVTSQIDLEKCKNTLEFLLLESQSRGKDSSGLATIDGNEILVLKKSVTAHLLLTQEATRELLKAQKGQSSGFIAMGHSRMETNGSFRLSYNNQPVIKDGCATIHNGIIVNDAELWARNTDLKRELDVDTEVINSLLRRELSKAPSKNPQAIIEAFRTALCDLKGSFSIATLFEDLDALFLATNTGSLYLLEDSRGGFLAFASEFLFVDRALEKILPAHRSHLKIRQLKPGQGMLLSFKDFAKFEFSLTEPDASAPPLPEITCSRKIRLLDDRSEDYIPRVHINVPRFKEIEKVALDEYAAIKPVIGALRRCTKCILPETMPFIHFDEKGVCSYCYRHQPRETQGLESLEKAIAPYRKKSGEPDCIVSFSGGRDSSYALHYAKKVLGLQPVAFSYDWGMLTDLGRRNQARMTGDLGVEHILVSADIQKKRSYIQKNILAWLKRPALGMIPLFMAGDKQYFYYLNKVRENTGIKLVIYADNALEKTDFKYGFANVELDSKVGKAYDIGRFNSLKLIKYYGVQYLTNPAYLNASLFDTFTAYLSSYVVPKEYVYLFRYTLWEERDVEETLLGQYDWELATDTKSSWRIGDGTAAFYNYIYYTMAGFTEQDTFRSNQIREGVITREEGLKQAETGNAPRVESFVWYCDTIGLDAITTLTRINEAQKLF
ncbi:hypothetical protein WDW86_04800 [Bdellovibrionota bacterium FG-2]